MYAPVDISAIFSINLGHFDVTGPSIHLLSNFYHYVTDGTTPRDSPFSFVFL